MNAREEIEICLRWLEAPTRYKENWAAVANRADRIRAILAAHDLVPKGEMAAIIDDGNYADI